MEDGALRWGSCVVIPSLREKVLDQAHPGVCRKNVGTKLVSWPCMDSDIEKKVCGCGLCAANHKMPSAAPIRHLEYPTKPWNRSTLNMPDHSSAECFLYCVTDFQSYCGTAQKGFCDSRFT